MKRWLGCLGVAVWCAAASSQDAPQWSVFAGGEGPGKGKRVVLVSGDEEYRSEEMLPQFARILAQRHGFDCTVLYAINPRTGFVDPTFTKNIPGLEALDQADLMVIMTRFRDLPDAQMAAIDRYLMAGKPVMGLRTATHAFNIDASSPWGHYGNGYSGPRTEWKDGFGRLVLGEQWINHHGEHKGESTRGILAPEQRAHPILRGLADGDVWGSTDVYGVRLPLPGDSAPLVLGQVMQRAGAFDPNDLHYGLRPTDAAAVEGAKNDPMMPVAWTKTYQLPGGTAGKAFASTLASSADFTSPGTRRLLVNAIYWLAGLDAQLPAEGANADLVGDYQPTKYEFRSPAFWREKAMPPAQ